MLSFIFTCMYNSCSNIFCDYDLVIDMNCAMPMHMPTLLLLILHVYNSCLSFAIVIWLLIDVDCLIGCS